MNKMELRFHNIELRDDNAEGKMVVKGYVNETGKLSKPLGVRNKFVEKIEPGAFQRSIDEGHDIWLYGEHKAENLLAGTRNGSLTLREDDKGLYFEAEIIDTPVGETFYKYVQRGLIQNMSFGFAVKEGGDSWEKRDGIHERTIHDLHLSEISLVRNPAYAQSTIQTRSLEFISEDESFLMQQNQNSIPQEENKMEQMNEKKAKEMEAQLRAYNEQKEAELRTATEVRTSEPVDPKEFEVRAVEQFIRQQNGEEIRAIKTDAAPGSLTIPTHLSNLIVEKLYERAPIFSRTRNFTPVNGFLEILKEGNHGTAGFVGEMENLAMNDFSLSKVKLDQKRVGTAIELSQHMINDSGIDIVNYAVNMMTKRLGQTIDANVLNGQKDNGQFEGILTTAITSIDKVTAASGTKIETDELLDLYNSMNPDYIGEAVWVMSRETFNMISKLKDGNGQYFLVKEFASTGPVYNILGRPVLIQEAMPRHQAGRGRTVIFANFGEGYATMTKKGLNFKRINADTKNALAGTETLMLDGYMDGKILNEDAIRVLSAPSA